MDSSRQPWFNSRALSIALVITYATALVVHSVSGAVYYSINSASLQIAAANAVRTGAQYLPMEPAAAVRSAVNYAENDGIAPNEIVLTKVAIDDRALTLSLCRKVPWYVGFLAFGLPNGEIRVTASARKTRRSARILA